MRRQCKCTTSGWYCYQTTCSLLSVDSLHGERVKIRVKMVAVGLRLHGNGLLVLRTVVGLVALRAVNGLVAFLAVILFVFFGTFATATAFALVRTIALADAFHDDLVSAFCATSKKYQFSDPIQFQYPNVPLRTNFRNRISGSTEQYRICIS